MDTYDRYDDEEKEGREGGYVKVKAIKNNSNYKKDAEE